MKRIKKIAGRIWRFIVVYKYLVSATFLSFFFIWLFCLPTHLFNDPTSTVIVDQHGNLLGATIADDGQWRFPHNPEVPEKFATAIIQFEDRSFRSHWGISVRGLGRALYQNLSSGERVSGGSTITMQLMRMSRKANSRSIWQKMVELFWATRAEWRYSKKELLALYASNAPMGGNVVGLDAAAWRYFGRSADQLSWAETATLAVLPNAPSLMHPGKNRDALLAKRNRLLNRLYTVEAIDSITWILAKEESLPEKPHPIPRIAPHLLSRAIKDGHKGQVVQTTILAPVQERTNQIVRFHHEQLRENEIYNAAVLITEVESGNVIAYAGNVPGVEPEHGRDVDIIRAPRSTGSILKPFLYAAMLEEGSITPKMLVQDVPTVMSGYAPKNYNLKYDGVVAADEALARSLNVPLVRLLTKYGVEKFHHTLNQLEFTTINRQPSHYGLSLILGGAEVNLWDLVSAYGSLVRTVQTYPNHPAGVNRKISYVNTPRDTNLTNRPVFSPATCWYTLEAMKEVLRPEDDINWELFSTSQQIAWKTGTSFGFRDAWAVGTNGTHVVGVWVGNADGEGRPGLIGREAAAPLLFDIFSSLPQSDWVDCPYDDMEQVAICNQSGYRAGEACPNTSLSFIPKTSLNTTACPYHQFIYLDETATYRVNASCYDMSRAQKRAWFTLPVIAEYFYKNRDPNYKKLPAYHPQCQETDNQEGIAILYPKPNSTIFVPVNFNEELEKIVFEATHTDEKKQLFWHLDNTYLGSTTLIHQLECVPSDGRHKLTIMDEDGHYQTIEFNVQLSEAGT